MKLLLLLQEKVASERQRLLRILAQGLRLMRKKVLMIDTDIGLRNLDVVMGLEHRILYNLVDVVEGNCRIRQAVIRDRQFPGLYLIPAAQTRDKSQR